MAKASVSEDYYSTLDVSPFASLDTIKESFKRLALRFHPDKNRDESATRDFQRLVVAWETLRDEGKRRDYDQLHNSTPRSHFEKARRRREDVDRDDTANWCHNVKLTD